MWDDHLGFDMQGLKRGTLVERLFHARQSIEEMLGEPAVVKIHVKVDKNWTKNEKSMKKYGYQIGKKKKA